MLEFSWRLPSQEGALTVRRPLQSLRLLFSHLRWLVGFVVGLAGWALYVAALRLAPLSLVQAVSAGGIGLLALLVERTTSVRLTRREWASVALAVAGLTLLGVSLVGHAGSGRHGSSLEVAALPRLVTVGLIYTASYLGMAFSFGLVRESEWALLAYWFRRLGMRSSRAQELPGS